MNARFKIASSLTAIALLAGMAILVPAQARQTEEDLHSDNMKMLARTPITLDKDVFAQGSDFAFQNKLVVAGSYSGPAFFKIKKKKPFIKQVGVLVCPGGQGDVSILGKFVFSSVDSARVGPECSPEDTATAPNNQYAAGEAFEGIRVISLKDGLKRPKQVGFINLDCGSHTHTIVPGPVKSYMYIESYPLGAQVPTCSTVSHRKVQIVEFDTKDPTKFKILDPLDVSPAIGCHDVTVFPEKNIAIAACISQSMVLDITDPAKPEVLSVINNPDIQIHHSSSFTWDGKYAILSDEYGGAASPGGCAADANSTIGAMWFYNVEDPANPRLDGHYSLPRIPPGADDPDEGQRFRCTTHLYTILPMKDPSKYIAFASYYAGGISGVDFSDPANPQEIAFYLPLPGGILPDMWAAYWYNGRVYANNHLGGQGVEVFKVKGYGKKTVRYYKGDFNPQIQISSQLK